jgi:hypothetical protein
MAFFKEHCFAGSRISSQMEFSRHEQLLNSLQWKTIRLALFLTCFPIISMILFKFFAPSEQVLSRKL